MHHGMRNPHSLKVICYADSLVDLNECLAVLPGAKISENICVAELNEILLNGFPNRCIKQSYVKEFDCVFINFKASVNIFE